MKKLFPLLLCYALMATQCFAISGGPNYGGGGRAVNVIGSYSGVIVGTTDLAGSSNPTIPGDATGVSVGNPTTSSALGLFDLTVPGVSTASGAFLLFASGQVYTGSISASADPDTGKLQGVLQGSDTITINSAGATGTTTTTTIQATAQGIINANIRPTTGTSNTTARLTGSAVLEVSFGGINTTTFQPVINETIMFTVSGFQQTSTTAATTTATGLTGATDLNGLLGF